MTIWEVGGQDRIRQLWRHYYQNADGLIFVVDSNDPGRMQEAREELTKVLSAPELANAAVLVLANKQDLPGAVSADQVATAMQLRDLKQQWFIQPCSVVQSDGVFEGLDWLAKEINSSSRSHAAAA